MNHLRFWIAATSAWLFVFYKIERLHAPLNIASFVYLLTACVAVGMLILPRQQRISSLRIGGAVLLVYFSLKLLLSYPIGGANLPITVTEICAILITLAMTRQIVKGIEQFEDAAADAAVMELNGDLTAFEADGQEGIYREIRRARQFERPLTLAALAPTDDSIKQSMNRLLKEMQTRSLKKYIFGRFAQVVSRKTSVCDLLARRNNHFLLLLPEADREQAGEVVQRLTETIDDELGLKVTTGLAAFPDEEVTLTGLVEHAESEMDRNRAEPTTEL